MIKILKNRFLIAVFLSVILFFHGCSDGYKLRNINNINELKKTIMITESLIKKIKIMPSCNDEYPSFSLFDSIYITHTLLNYSTNNKENPKNIQCLSDDILFIPGLTEEECSILKFNLLLLKKYGIKTSEIAYYSDDTFRFFYYGYYYPANYGFRSIGYLAVLSKEIVNTDDFNLRFQIMDFKDGLYFIRRNGLLERYNSLGVKTKQD